MAPEIVQHGHCHVCGRVVKYGETTCSEKCGGEWEKTRRNRRRMTMILYALMGVFLLAMILPGLLNGSP